MPDIVNYKREMVTLFCPFLNEEVDILDNNKFLEIYDNSVEVILERRKEFESNINIEKTIEICRLMCAKIDENTDAAEKMEEFVKSKQIDDDFLQMKANDDDIRLAHMEKMSSVIRKRENVMSS